MLFTAIWPDRAQTFGFTLRPKVGKGDKSFLEKYKDACAKVLAQHNLALTINDLKRTVIFVKTPTEVKHDQRSKNPEGVGQTVKLPIDTFLNDIRLSMKGEC